MTQRHQYLWWDSEKERLVAKCVAEPTAYRYTPGQPDDTEMIERLAMKAQLIAVAFGTSCSWEEARLRAMQNLADVRAMAGGAK